jgi:hypothetical protein
MRANEIAIETAKTGKVTAVVAAMSIFCKKKYKSRSANPGNEKPSCQKAESSNFLGEKLCKPRILVQKTRKGCVLKKIAPKSKKLEINGCNKKLNSKKSCLVCTTKSDPSFSYGLTVKNKTMRVMLDSGSSGKLLFVKNESINHISAVKQAVFQLWSTSNGTFDTDKVGDI